ncbi:MAG TPA: DUF4097 family beta strand repeat-containing protein, partial [Pyrinomonadaceae bacterium]
TVRGWNKKEVRARSTEAEQIELRRIEMPGEQSTLAKKIDVYIDDKGSEGNERGDCQASADVDLDVPEGATVQIQTRDGDITIVGVSAAYAGSQNGDISIDHVSQKIEAGSIGGSISIKDSSGRVTLTTAGGGIEASNITPAEADDSFEVTSVSGDIQLQKVGQAKLTAKSVTGNINLLGSLAHKGEYGFNTMSGDVTLALPADASFRLIAKLAQDGEIITDFPLTLTTETLSPAKPRAPETRRPEPTTPAPPAPQSPSGTPAPSPSPKPAKPEKSSPGNVTIVKVAPEIKVTPMTVTIPYTLRRVIAVHGSGDAAISVASFSGTLHLQKN